MGINKEDLKKLLAGGLIYVEFVKKDGSLRKMWCTRNNRIIDHVGHDFIKFSGPALSAQERRLGYVYVFDIQEGDTRLLNPKTVDVTSVKFFSTVEDANIPNIVSRFEKEKIKENGICSDDVNRVQKVKNELDTKADTYSSVDDLF